MSVCIRDHHVRIGAARVTIRQRYRWRDQLDADVIIGEERLCTIAGDDVAGFILRLEELIKLYRTER